jgi:hypothetical protein
MRGRQHRDHRRQRHGHQHTSPPAELHQCQLPLATSASTVSLVGTSAAGTDVEVTGRGGQHPLTAGVQPGPPGDGAGDDQHGDGRDGQ